ncbi:MAG TPA: hypothetical protein VK856_09870, partial [Anaerolineaceae bacterium]|nr:hypothetical protein [Anaerolineaceae bacterium]
DWVKRYPDVLWFEEGIEAKFSPRVNRQNLQPAETLILYTLPPNLTELKKILITVRPKTLFLFGNSPFPGSLNNTIKNVVGILKFVVAKRDGLFNSINIASATGHRVTTVELICRYLHAEGKITLSDHPDTQWFVQLGGSPNRENVEFYKKSIEFNYRETLAFHRWLLDLSVENLRKIIFDF